MRLLLACIFYVIAFVGFAQNELKNEQAVISTSGSIITLHNFELTNNGTIRDSAATWYISGAEDTLDSEIGGDSLSVINNLTVNKTTGDQVVQLKGDFEVLGTISLTSGSINLNQYDIELGENGRIESEDNNNRIFGYTGGTIFKDTSLNSPSSANPGNMGLVITSSSNLGATRVIRGHNTQYNADSSWNSINRWYDFVPTTNSSLNATLRFYYLDVEISPYFHADLDMWEDPSGIWTQNAVPFNAANRDSANTWMQLTGFDSLVRITLGPDSIPILPIDLISFDVNWIDAPTISNVTWQTASEDNVSFYTVERSYDGLNFESIYTLNNIGSSTEIKTYSYTDDQVNQPSFTDIVYYRLRQADYSGEEFESQIVPLIYSAKNGLSVAVYPNPTKEKVVLRASSKVKNLTIQVLDNNGALIKEQVMENMSKFEIDMTELTSGTYFISVLDQNSGFREVVQVVKTN